jgi:cell wall-associated NlpC family hydrolase
VAAVAGIGVALTLAVMPAGAEPVPPSDEEIAAAQEAEALAEASVAEVEAMLTDLRAATETTSANAGLAAEAYNQAMVDLDAAEADAAEAIAEVEATQGELTVARSALAHVALSASDATSSLAIFEPFLHADALDEALARAELLDIAGTTSSRATERFAVADQAARAASTRADQAVDLREQRAEAAERAAAKAERAAVSAIEAERKAEKRHQLLLEVLAEKRGTTADLEAQAEAARIAEENEQARLAAEALQASIPDPEPTQPVTPEEPPASDTSTQPSGPPAAPPTDSPADGVADPEVPPASGTPPETPAAGESPAGGAPATEPPAGQDPTGTSPSPDPSPSDTAPAAPPETSDPVGTPSTPEAGIAAVEWARAQIGIPYRWGGSGPDGFDCSGLTSQAWRNGGGKAIPRTAASQYAAATKIPFDSMRPGDLIFWGSSAAAIYHVAIYSGDGMMVEAPRAGETVTEIPIRWSGVFGYAGRF